ncbi:hypothetical protein TNCV_4493441 [Trichonephila clavipes]|uniref:DUF5641 domain-containing protein n=1 Tax=Trichonephila clavipes TaxID=2585209 RepID=A0A8X6SMY4_TRICX|nr:hypothetical protein TNCV_4493441 [Trichonephila clavipes]
MILMKRQQYNSQLISSKTPEEQKKLFSLGQITKGLIWPLGRVIELYPGKEGNERVSKLRVANGFAVRPLQRLYPLEMSVSDLPSDIALDNLVALHFKYDQARRRFVEWAQNEIAVVPDFHKRILFSDEAHFRLNGYVNKQNFRIWSEANPQVYVETPLHPEKLTVCCALWAGGILLQKR